MNSELDPLDFENEIDFPNLEAIYNEHVRHTHRRALEKVFYAGVHYILGMAADKAESGDSKTQQKLDDLQIQYAALQQKYDALNAKFNINQPQSDATEAELMPGKLATQAMDMGNVFRSGRTV